MPGKLKLIMVDWLDTTSHGGWREKEEFMKSPALLCRTIGFLVGDDGESLKMAASHSNSGDWNDRTSIPKRSIIRKQILDIKMPKLERDKAKGKR